MTNLSRRVPSAHRWPALAILMLVIVSVLLLNWLPDAPTSIALAPTSIPAPPTSLPLQPASDEQALRARPLILPTINDGRCPITTVPNQQLVADSSFALLGAGPVYIGYATPDQPLGTATFGAGPGSKPWSEGPHWKTANMMWVALDGYDGPILLRGGELTRDSTAQHNTINFKIDNDRREYEYIPPGAARQSNGSRLAPFAPMVREPGCYALQIDGETWSYSVVFQAEEVPFITDGPSASALTCEPTPYTTDRPPPPNTDWYSRYWMTNDQQTLWANLNGPTIYTEQVVGLWRNVAGTLVVSGTNRVQPSGGLSAEFLSGNSDTSPAFYRSVLHFGGPGCWDIVATAGDQTLRFTVRVEAFPTLSQQPGKLLISSNSLNPVGDIAWSQVSIKDLYLAGPRWSYLVDSQADDGLPSRNGTRLYVLGAAGEHVRAYETANGHEIWHTQVTQRVNYILGQGPSVLALSPDGRWLYVHSYDSAGGDRAPTWLQVIDTANGTVQSDKQIPLPSFADCGGPQFLTPPAGKQIYIICSTSVRVLDLTTNTISPLGPAVSAGAALAPDGNTFYIITYGPDVRVLAIDPHSGATLAEHPLPELSATIRSGLVALSGDGTRLVLGRVLEQNGSDRSSELYVYDTATWNLVTSIVYPRPISPNVLAISPNGSAIYAVTGELNRPLGDTIVEFNATSGAVRAEYVRPNENILRLRYVP